MKYLIADLAHKVGATDVKVEPTRLNPEKGLRDHPGWKASTSGSMALFAVLVRPHM